MRLRHPREWAWINAVLPYYRGLNRLLPTAERCKRCWAPFGGPFSPFYQLALIRRSRKNPHLCTS